MADAAETRALLLTIQANTELLRSNLTQAERAVQEFTDKTQHHLSDQDHRFELLGRGIEKLERPLEHLRRVGEGAFAFLVGESLIHKGREALEFAGNIEFMAKQIGVSTDFLQKFRFAAGQSSVDIDTSNTALTRFTRSVGEAANGNKKSIKAFEDAGHAAGGAGIKVLDAGGKVRSVEAIFADTAEAISKIPDPAQRTAAAMALFGRGAAPLVPLLMQGATGFNQLAAEAERLGIVLSPELIKHSEEVNHKLAALKMILDAQMASAVAENATAINAVAGALIHVAGGIAKFLSSNPEHALAVLGALAGMRIAGPWGGVAGAAAGRIYGHELWQESQDNSNDRGTRSRALVEAERKWREASARNSITDMSTGIVLPINAGDPHHGPEYQEYARQLALYRQAKRRGFGGPVTDGEGGNLGSDGAGASNPDTSHHKSAEELAREAEAARQKALAEDRAFQGELRTAQEARQKAAAGLADTAQAQLAVELQALQDALITRKEQVDDQVSAGKITVERGKQLKLLYDQTEDDEEELARRKEQSRLIGERTAKESQGLQGAIDLLQLDEQLTTTRKDRLAIELQLLEYQERLAKKAQWAIVDDPTKSKADRDLARGRIDQIDAQHDRNVAEIKRQNESPLEAYRDQLKAAVGDTNDALQSVEVHALQGLEDQVAGTIGKVLGLKGAFGELAESVLTDLARIEIERAILGAAGGGGGGLFSSIGHLFGGGRAAGGGIDASKFYVVGEKGPEIFAPGASGRIIPNGALQAPRVSIGGSSGGSDRVHVTTDVTVKPSALFATEVQSVAVHTVAAAAEPIMNGAQARTMRSLSRPALAGGFA